MGAEDARNVAAAILENLPARRHLRQHLPQPRGPLHVGALLRGRRHNRIRHREHVAAGEGRDGPRIRALVLRDAGARETSSGNGRRGNRGVRVLMSQEQMVELPQKKKKKEAKLEFDAALLEVKPAEDVEIELDTESATFKARKGEGGDRRE